MKLSINTTLWIMLVINVAEIAIGTITRSTAVGVVMFLGWPVMVLILCQMITRKIRNRKPVVKSSAPQWVQERMPKRRVYAPTPERIALPAAKSSAPQWVQDRQEQPRVFVVEPTPVAAPVDPGVSEAEVQAMVDEIAGTVFEQEFVNMISDPAKRNELRQLFNDIDHAQYAKRNI